MGKLDYAYNLFVICYRTCKCIHEHGKSEKRGGGGGGGGGPIASVNVRM